jgi:two-component system, LytTR family, sensor kinase
MQIAPKHKIAFSVIAVLSVVSSVVRGFVFPEINWGYHLADGGLTFVLNSCLWLFSNWLNNFLNDKLKYEQNIKKRIVIQFLSGVMFVLFLQKSIFFILTNPNFHQRLHQLKVFQEFNRLTEIVSYGLIVFGNLAITFAFAATFSLKKWQENALKVANLEKEKSLVQFDNLKNQLNPHFLFNSLTSLDSLIQDDPKLAREFLQQLSKVFRYLLQSKEKGVVSLETELSFIQNYVALLETRFGENLKINIDVNKDDLEKKIVPATLQILIENAIKHNVIDKANSLVINILTLDNYLFVENNTLQKKQVETSNRQGLNNLKSLYGFLSKRPLEASQNAENSPNLFSVKVPLL